MKEADDTHHRAADSGVERGEAILFGSALPLATRIKVVRPHPEPDSADPPFVSAWDIRPT